MKKKSLIIGGILLLSLFTSQSFVGAITIHTSCGTTEGACTCGQTMEEVIDMILLIDEAACGD